MNQPSDHRSDHSSDHGSDHSPDHGTELKAAAQRKLSFWHTLQAVAWSFFGVRKSADYAKDVSQLNPVHLVIAGVLGAVVFIAVLLTLVNLIISSGVAA